MANKQFLNILDKKLIIKASEASKYLSSNKELTRMFERGEIYQLGGGYYCSWKIDPEIAALLVVTKYYPYAVISRTSALRVHELGVERIRKVQIDIPNTKSLKNELFDVYRVSPKYMKGIITLDYLGHKIRVYSKERSLFEALKEYGKTSDYFKAIKRYAQDYQNSHSKKVEEYDQLFNEDISSDVAQELTDDFY